MLSGYQTSPRGGHLDKIYHLFSFLKKKPKLTLYFDPRELLIDPSWFQGNSVENFKGKYQYTEEKLPPSRLCPETIGVPISTTEDVDASHAYNKVTRCRHNLFIIFFNRDPIICYIKIHNTVEASTFSSEFIAAKACV